MQPFRPIERVYLDRNCLIDTLLSFDLMEWMLDGILYENIGVHLSIGAFNAANEPTCRATWMLINNGRIYNSCSPTWGICNRTFPYFAQRCSIKAYFDRNSGYISYNGTIEKQSWTNANANITLPVGKHIIIGGYTPELQDTSRDARMHIYRLTARKDGRCIFDAIPCETQSGKKLLYDKVQRRACRVLRGELS